jgi:hypothetical protein
MGVLLYQGIYAAQMSWDKFVLRVAYSVLKVYGSPVSDGISPQITQIIADF